MEATMEGEQTADDLAREALENEGDPEDEAEDNGQMFIPGTAPTISMQVGGPRPSASELRLQGGSVGIEGEFKKGEVITLLVTVRVQDISFPSTFDDDGNATSTKRRHIARPISVTRADIAPDV